MPSAPIRRERISADGSGWCTLRLCGGTLDRSFFCNTANESAIAFDKDEFVSKARFK